MLSGEIILAVFRQQKARSKRARREAEGRRASSSAGEGSSRRSNLHGTCGWSSGAILTRRTGQNTTIANNEGPSCCLGPVSVPVFWEVFVTKYLAYFIAGIVHTMKMSSLQIRRRKNGRTHWQGTAIQLFLGVANFPNKIRPPVECHPHWFDKNWHSLPPRFVVQGEISQCTILFLPYVLGQFSSLWVWNCRERDQCYVIYLNFILFIYYYFVFIYLFFIYFFLWQLSCHIWFIWLCVFTPRAVVSWDAL